MEDSIQARSRRSNYMMNHRNYRNPLKPKPQRIAETLRFPTSIHLKQECSPTRSQLMDEAVSAFSSNKTEHLTNVRRTRNNITGETFAIAGDIVENNKNFLSKFLDLFKNLKKYCRF